jgi:hypothetical protein
MKAYQPTDLGRAIVRFFQEYLPTLRGMSHHTIRSYRDGMILFLRFATTDGGRPIESLKIADITAERIGRFLAWLERRPARRGRAPRWMKICPLPASCGSGGGSKSRRVTPVIFRGDDQRGGAAHHDG